MDQEALTQTEPTEQKGIRTRAMAGRALLVFVLLMIGLTWAGQMLESMTIATVTTTSVQRGALEKRIRASGTLEASETVPVVVSDAARVLSVQVKAGASVEAGDPLFQLDYTDIVKSAYDALQTATQTAQKKQQTLDWATADLGVSTAERILRRVDSVAALEAKYLEAEAAGGAQANVAKSNYESEKRLLDADTAARDYLSKRDEAIDAAQDVTDLEQAFLELLQGLDGLPAMETAKDALAQYAAGASYTKTIAAPVSGTVLECGVSSGAMASTNSPSVKLSNREGGLSLTVWVDEDSAGEMAAGETARITAGGQTTECPILSIISSAEKQDMYEVQFLLSADAGASPGMNAEMSFTRRTQNYDILIPLSALRHDSDGDFVLTVKQEETSLGARMSAVRVDVYVVDQDSGRAALQSGVSQRDVVIERSDRSLSDGDRVRIADQ